MSGTTALIWMMIACIGIPAAAFVIFYVADAWVRVHALNVMLEYAKKVDKLDDRDRAELENALERLGVTNGKEEKKG